VDVPGHEDFVKNMVAGVGAIDVALLVIASDDGWMPQTEEHLQILSYFGVQRSVVAVTKAELVQDEPSVVRDVRERLRGTALADVAAVEGVHRGDVVTLAEHGSASDVLDVLLHISPRASHHVKDGARVRAHHGSGNVAARVALAAKEELTPGSRAIAQLRLET